MDSSEHRIPCRRESSSPHSSRLRQHRRYAPDGTFLVTKRLQTRAPSLIPSTAACLTQTLCFRAGNGDFLLAAFIVMPDHWHAVLAPCGGRNVTSIMNRIGNWVSKQSSGNVERPWQEGFHETRIRSSRQFIYALHYVEENPVRAGLVDVRARWQWSSANPENRPVLSIPWPWSFEQDEV